MSTPPPPKELANLPVSGMTCASCVASIEKAIKGLPGVIDAAVNLSTETAAVEYETSQVDIKKIKGAIESVGYGVPLSKIELPITGMTCAGCVGNVEKAIYRVKGVISASVNLATETASIEYLSNETDIAKIKKSIEDSGYGVAEVSEEEEDEDPQQKAREEYYKSLKRKFIVSTFLSGLILIGSFQHLFPFISAIPRYEMFYILLLLALPVQFWAGSQFYKGFWSSLKHFSADMNTLIAVGTSSAFIYSLVATVFPQLFTSAGREPQVYYDTSAIIITLILLGKLLEVGAKGHTSDAIKKLIGLSPKTATVVRDGVEMEIDVSEVSIGDIVLVKPGGKVPTDGIIIKGSSTIDESMLTGESIPSEKREGDEVIGGTINKIGSFQFKATRVGKDTVLSQIIKMVKEAQGSKAPIQRLADKIAGVFVPFVIGIAIITFFVWFLWGPTPALTYALLNFVAVMIIACPCALGLATPTAIMVGTGRGAENGILIKGGETLENAHRINMIVFDKTGTLTKGEPELSEIITANGFNSEKVLQLAASAEKHSEHPIAKAVLKAALEQKVELTELYNFEASPGFGIQAEIDGKTIKIGKEGFITPNYAEIKDVKDKIDNLVSQGKTVLLLSVDGLLAGAIAVADALKPNSKEVINDLHGMDIKTVMITGDNIRTAKSIGEKLGIDKILAEVLPEGKATEIKRLQDEGGFVAMVGDGINDAVALAQADVGIALGSGTDVAIEASDITLIGDNLKGVIKAIKLSKRTMRTIKWNLFWAFAYNTAGIPIAAGILYPFWGILLNPIFASAAMAFSSVFVVTNSLRLRRVGL